MPPPLKYDDNSPMPFGEHQGKPLEKVPARYLVWLHSEMEHGQRSPVRQALFEYIEENMDALEMELQEERNHHRNR